MYDMILAVDCVGFTPEAVLFQQKQYVPSNVHKIYITNDPNVSNAKSTTTDWVKHYLSVWPERYSPKPRIMRISASTIIPEETLRVALSEPTPIHFTPYRQSDLDKAMQTLGDYAYVPTDCRVSSDEELVLRSSLNPHFVHVIPEKCPVNLNTEYLKQLTPEQQLSSLRVESSLVSTVNKPIAHFIWLNGNQGTRELPFNIFCSMLTFHLHNPTVKILFHTNVKWIGPLVKKLPAKILHVDLSLFPFKVTHHRWQVHYSDYYRYLLLNRFGGIYLDCADTITLGSILEEYKAANSLTYHKVFPETDSGFLLCNGPEKEISPVVLDNFANNYASFTRYAHNEGFISSTLRDKLRNVVKRGTVLLSLLYTSECKVHHFFNTGVNKGGVTTLNNYKTNETLYARVLRESLRRANGYLLS